MAPELKPLLTEGARKRAFRRRFLGLKKKISELSILCDVDACFICSQDISPLQKTTVWPENSSELERIISRYAKLGKKGEQEAEKGTKKKRKRKEVQLSCSYPTCDRGLNGLSKAYLIDLVRALDSKIDSVKNRIAFCEKQNEITPNQQAALPTIPLVSENQPKPLDNYLPMCPDFDLGIESYSNLGTVDSTASVVGFAAPETRHQPINLDFGIESYGNVGAADSSLVSFAGPETRLLPVFSDLDYDIESYGNVDTADSVASEAGFSGPETSHLPEATEGGVQELYGNEGTCDQPTSDISLWAPESNENLWMEDDQMAMDNLDLGIMHNSGMDAFLEELGSGIFNNNELGPVSDQPCISDSAVVNSPSYPPQNLVSPLPERPCNFSSCNNTSPIPRYSGFQKYM